MGPVRQRPKAPSALTQVMQAGVLGVIGRGHGVSRYFRDQGLPLPDASGFTAAQAAHVPNHKRAGSYDVDWGGAS